LINTFHPCIFYFVGRKKSGKTTLLEFIIEELVKRGYRVGALKHSSHLHPLDKSGSDSERLGISGAIPSVFTTPGGLAIFCKPDDSLSPQRVLREVFSSCQIVLVESFRQHAEPKILVRTEKDDVTDLTGISAVVNMVGHHPLYPAFRPTDPY
jgi:molybdopterin-guanine dinucleotide biosynthesis protein B